MRLKNKPLSECNERQPSGSSKSDPPWHRAGLKPEAHHAHEHLGMICGSKLTGFHNLIDEVYQEAGGHIVADEVVAKVAFHQEIKHQGAVVPV